MLGVDEWKQAGLLLSLAPAAMGLVMTPETGPELWICFQKVGFGENTQTQVITARSCNKSLCFMVSPMQLKCQKTLMYLQFNLLLLLFS